MSGTMQFDRLGADNHIAIAKFLGRDDMISLAETCSSLSLVAGDRSVRSTCLLNDIGYVFAKTQPKFKPLTTTRCQIVEVTYADVAIGDIVLVLRTRESGRLFHKAVIQAYAWGGMQMVVQTLSQIGAKYPVWLSFYRLLFSEGYHDMLIEYVQLILHEESQEQAECSISKALIVHNQISAGQITQILGVGFNTAVCYNFVGTVRLLLKQCRLNPVADATYALNLAAYKGHTDVVSILLDNTTLIADDNDSLAFRLACYEGHAGTVRRMLADGRCDPTSKYSKGLRMAACYGHTRVVRLLLDDERSDPSACDSMALQVACENNHVSVVRLLLRDGRVDPMANKNYALNISSGMGHAKVESMLVVAMLGSVKQDLLKRSERKSLRHARKVLRLTEPDMVEKKRPSRWMVMYEWCIKNKIRL